MDEEHGGGSEEDSRQDRASKSSGNPAALQDENNRPSGSGSTSNFTFDDKVKVDKVKKKVKKQTCHRRRDSSGEEAESNKPSSSSSSSCCATFHKLQKRVKRRSYRKATSAGEEAVEENATAETSEGQNTSTIDEDNSSSKSDGNDQKNPSDNSDEWTTDEENTYTAPLVLRKIKPKYKVSILNEVMNRQIGNSRRFDKKLYGSLHMVERLKYLHSLDAHQGCVNTVEFNQKGDLLVSGSDDLAVIVWNWATGKKLNSYESGHRNNIFQASWLPNGDTTTMVTCASDGQVRLLDLINGTTQKLAMHHGACNQFTIHPETPQVAISVGDDGKILCIDVRDHDSKKLVTLKGRGSPVQLYTISSNPRNVHEFCVGGHSRSVRIYDRRRAIEPLFHLCPKNLVDNERVHVTSVTYNDDGTEVLASYNDDDIYLFDTLIPHPNGDYAHKYEGHRNSKTIKGVSYFGPAGEFIVSGSDCGNIYFWEKNTEAIVQCMTGDAQGVVNRVKPHPLIPVLASSGLDDDIKIWVPSADEAPALSELKECVTTNMNDRAEERPQFRNRYDGDLFCVILEHLCQNHELFSLLSESLSGGNFDEDDDDDD